ncbi:MAG: protease HtpX [Deltaproteobacteria bacterium]|nr:protease HtpX [Deltaproteobacteria bacterium]
MVMRITLFLLTNIAVLFVLTIVLNVLGLNQPGTNWTSLLMMAGIMGFAGSFISLMMSKTIAKKSSGAQVITSPSSETEQWLIDTVRSQAEKKGIGMPEVAIFDSPAPNAFATGANKNSSLVAVSTGLLSNMTRDEAEAVLGHEMSHVANGDMVTLSLIQGVVNTFVIVLSQIVSALVDRRQGGGYNSRGYGFGRGIGYRGTYMISQLVLGFLATLIVRWFSRWREYRADAGGAALAGREKMIHALERLSSLQEPAQLPVQMQALGINGGLFGAAGLKKLTMTHPPLADRIRALRKGAK